MKRLLSVIAAIAVMMSLVSFASAETPTKKTQLWWMINAARGNGAFSLEFELARTPAQIESGAAHGQRGILEGKDGVIRVYNRNADGTFTEATNSAVMTMFGTNLRLLTQMNHNHNNERTTGDPTSRPFPAPHPEWLGLTDNGVGFGNGGYELFPRIAPASLTSALNPFEMNIPPLQTVVDAPEAALLFVYDNGAMAAAHYNGVWMRITNLQNSAGASPVPDANPETGTPSAIPAIIAVAGLGAAVVIAGVLSKKKRRIK
jgi:lipocalin